MRIRTTGGRREVLGEPVVKSEGEDVSAGDVCGECGGDSGVGRVGGGTVWGRGRGDRDEGGSGDGMWYVEGVGGWVLWVFDDGEHVCCRGEGVKA